MAKSSVKKAKRTIGTRFRFTVLNRDNFTCTYCGAMPGNDRLHVDHLMPFGRGGSDHENNLLGSCDRCNGGKLDRIIIPKRLMIGVDNEGWSIWKQWGVWSIKLSEEHDNIVIAGDVGYEYWLDLDRVHEPDWERHIKEKTWDLPHTFMDFYAALHFGKTLMRKPECFS